MICGNAEGIAKAGTSGKEPRRWGFDPWVGKIPLEKEMATHSSTLAWTIPWTEEPGGLQSRGLQRVRDNWSDLACITESITGKWTPDFGSMGIAQTFYRVPPTFNQCNCCVTCILASREAKQLHSDSYKLFSWYPTRLDPLGQIFCENDLTCSVLKF